MNKPSFQDKHPVLVNSITLLLFALAGIALLLIKSSGYHKLTPEKPFIEDLSVEEHHKLLLGMGCEAEQYRYKIEEYNKVLEASSPEVRGDLKKIEVK